MKVKSNLPLMPKATAVWLIENTSLTFKQIADFCGLHPLEVKGIADDEVAHNILGVDPIMNGQLTVEEINRCQEDSKASLRLAVNARTFEHFNKSGSKTSAKYTPMARRRDKPDAIAWLIKHCPEMSESQIVKLIGTTKTTIAAVIGKYHWNSDNIRPRDPVLLGLCTQSELNEAFNQAQRIAELKAAKADEASK